MKIAICDDDQQELSRINQLVEAFLCTSFSEYKIEIYCFNSSIELIDQIEKGNHFDVFILDVIMGKINDICSNLNKYILVKTQPSLSKIFLHELIYVDVFGRTVCFHQKGGVTTESTSTISQVEPLLLNDNRFIKPHRSYIVNMDYMKKLLSDGFTTTGGIFIPISRNVYKEVKQAYINHSFKV